MPMNMARPPINQTGRNNKRGFTLTEIAIVLGIIGLILGAIWVAASAVYSNLRTSKATTELLSIAQAIRAMYATQSTVDKGADMPTVGAAQSGGGLTYVQANIFPSDTLTPTAVPTYAIDPWYGSINITSAQAVTPQDSFAIEFDAVPQSACISMLTSNTGSGRDAGLYAVAANKNGTLSIGTGGGNTGGTLVTGTGVTASTAQTLCTNASNNVAFQFKLK